MHRDSAPEVLYVYMAPDWCLWMESMAAAILGTAKELSQSL